MGMAQKLDPTLIKTADIWETTGCPLARLVRQGLKKRGFDGHFTAVYNPERFPLRETPLRETPLQRNSPADGAGEMAGGFWDKGKKVINGSSVTVTASAGLVLASLVIRDINVRHSHVPEDKK